MPLQKQQRKAKKQERLFLRGLSWRGLWPGYSGN